MSHLIRKVKPLETITDRTTLENPYIIDGPVTNRRMFFGREDLFAQIRLDLAGQSPKRPLILHGPAKIGKTSILKQLELGVLGSEVVVVFADLRRLSLETLNNFLWDLAHAAVKSLKQRTQPAFEAPQLERSAFLVAPRRAFTSQFLQPLLDYANGKPILIALDEIGVLAGPKSEGHLERAVFNYLHELSNEYPNIHYVFTLGASPPAVLPPFEQVQYERIGNLDDGAAARLLSHPVPYNVFSDVRKLVGNISGGHPAATQTIGHALFARWQSHQLRHIMIADVVDVMKHQPTAVNFPLAMPLHQALSHIDNGRAAKPTLPSRSKALRPARTNATSPSSHAGRRKWRTGWWVVVPGLLLIMLAGAFLWPEKWLHLPGLAYSNVVPPTPTTTPQTMAESEISHHVAQATPRRVTRTPQPTATAASATATPTATTAPLTLADIEETTEATATSTPTPTPSATATVTAAPTARSEPILTREADGMTMLLIPAGSFIMGGKEGDPRAGPDEFPQHEVSLDSFYIDQFEVSVAQYADFLNTLGTYQNACNNADCGWPRQRIGATSYLLETNIEGENHYVALRGFENYPINHVNWHGASAYCQAMGARLPTEAEWEYAARGSDGRDFPWGSEQPNRSRAIYQSDSFEDLKPVDALPDGASPFGVYAMAGSMWEWVSDWYQYDYYSISPMDNPQGPESGPGKITRGGAWPNNNHADRIRSANRNWVGINFISSAIGFRCAATP